MGSDCGESLGDGNFEGFQQAGFGSAQQFFHLGPSLLDGIEVGRVGRQVEQLRAAGFNQGMYAGDFMRGLAVSADMGGCQRSHIMLTGLPDCGLFAGLFWRYSLIMTPLP
jgi:hypothetical protein